MRQVPRKLLSEIFVMLVKPAKGQRERTMREQSAKLEMPASIAEPPFSLNCRILE